MTPFPAGNLNRVLQAFANGSLVGHAHGEGPVEVVWLHGWGRSGADFDASAARLGHASLALDLPGFGGSSAPDHAGGARLYADLIRPVLAGLGRPVVLVGHSFGGRVATVLAATSPELVSGLVLTGAPLIRRQTASRPPLVYRVARALHRRGLLGESTMEKYRQRFGSADYRAAHGVMRDVLVASVNESYEAELDKVTCPVRLVWGSNDRDVPVSVAEAARERLGTRATVQVLNGVGHHVPLEAPDELGAAAQSLVVS